MNERIIQGGGGEPKTQMEKCASRKNMIAAECEKESFLQGDHSAYDNLPLT